MAMRNWSATTANTRYFVKGSWPQSFVIWRDVRMVSRRWILPLDGPFELIVVVFDVVLLGLPVKRLEEIQLRRYPVEVHLIG